jgi:nitrile hydratase subunit alpha
MTSPGKSRAIQELERFFRKKHLFSLFFIANSFGKEHPEEITLGCPASPKVSQGKLSLVAATEPGGFSPMNHEDENKGRSAADKSRRDFLKAAGTVGVLTAGGAVSAPGALSAQETVAGSPVNPLSLDSARENLGGTPILDAGSEGAMPLPPLQARVQAMMELLETRGVLPQPMVELFVEVYSSQVGPYIGKAVVAHAWADAAFRDALLNPEAPNFEPYKSHPQRGPFAATIYIREWLDAAASEAGFLGFQWPPAGGLFGSTVGAEGEFLRVVANGTEADGGRVHNLVVCTLCSCYPQALLGVQPVWYKSRQYRSRAQTSPRGVIREFAEGTPGQAAVESYLSAIDEVRVWDSNSEVRFLVIPERPAETEGLDEVALRQHITRDGLIGTRIV